MRNKDKTIKNTIENETSSLIYACLCTLDYNSNNRSIVNYIIDSLYNLDFEVYPHLNFFPDKGGARNIMNDVSSYRVSKGYKIKGFRDLNDLFSKYGCKDNNDIKKLIHYIYDNVDNITEFDEVISKAIMAYKTYYKNGVSLEKWPNDINLYRDYFVNMIKSHDDSSFTDVTINSTNNKSINSLNMNHIRYPEVKILALTSGEGLQEERNASYKFIDYINEWFNSSNPYSEEYEKQLENAIRKIDRRISLNDNTNTSASVVIITNDKTYIISAGNTRVSLIENDSLFTIKRNENLYDDIMSKNKILPFSEEYAKSIPIGTIGYNKDNIDKFNSKVDVVSTSLIDGIFITTSSIHDNISVEDLSMTLKYNTDEEVLDTLSILYELYKSSNGIILWKKESKQKKKHLNY